MDLELMYQLYATMCKIRIFEEQCAGVLLEGKIPANLHTSIGQEAVAAGTCSALRSEDWIVSNHRGHGHCIAKGVALNAMAAEIFGKVDGTNGGRGGSMHIADPAKGILGTNGVVGGGIGIATGAAYGAYLEGENKVVVCFFGDGATSQGILHESMNLASLWSLPIIYLCENNQYAEMTPQRIHTAVPDIAVRAAGYAMPGAIIDGNDVIAVREAVLAATTRARSGGGPSFIECKTYRIRGHFEGDPQKYKPTGEQEEWEGEKDPIQRLQNRVLTLDSIAMEKLILIRQEIQLEVEEAIQYADRSEFPDPRTLMDHVFS